MWQPKDCMVAQRCTRIVKHCNHDMLGELMGDAASTSNEAIQYMLDCIPTGNCDFNFSQQLI
jgi:hypothetical protein